MKNATLEHIDDQAFQAFLDELNADCQRYFQPSARLWSLPLLVPAAELEQA